mmetsp:Transcript_20801/g.33513  ORF Transcript_20801/g.33513 Transcript_20801/m.33513 type:complete len:288 (-) Transcript_20801:1135-1998(-)
MEQVKATNGINFAVFPSRRQTRLVGVDLFDKVLDRFLHFEKLFPLEEGIILHNLRKSLFSDRRACLLVELFQDFGECGGVDFQKFQKKINFAFECDQRFFGVNVVLEMFGSPHLSVRLLQLRRFSGSICFGQLLQSKLKVVSDTCGTGGGNDFCVGGRAETGRRSRFGRSGCSQAFDTFLKRHKVVDSPIFLVVIEFGKFVLGGLQNFVKRRLELLVGDIICGSLLEGLLQLFVIDVVELPFLQGAFSESLSKLHLDRQRKLKKMLVVAWYANAGGLIRNWEHTKTE